VAIPIAACPETELANSVGACEVERAAADGADRRSGRVV